MDKKKARQIADRISEAAEESATVSVYIDEYTVRELLKEYEQDALVKYIEDRRALGFEPTADDILDWIKNESL